MVALTDADDEERKETEDCAGQKDGYGENRDVRVIALLAFPVAVIRVLADRDGLVLHGSEVTLCRVMAGSRVVRGFRSDASGDLVDFGSYLFVCAARRETHRSAQHGADTSGWSLRKVARVTSESCGAPGFRFLVSADQAKTAVRGEGASG